jgi:hypothetical protein
LVIGHWLNSYYLWLLIIDQWLLAIDHGYWPFTIGYWLLTIDHWLNFASYGHWPLVIGYWLLVKLGFRVGNMDANE